MFTLNRNKQKIYIKDFTGNYILSEDENGYLTGERVPEYTEPRVEWTHVSSAKGSRDEWLFGDSFDYDRVIFDSDIDIKEDSVLWVDNVLEFENDPNTPHDYKVVRVSHSLNSISVALKRVNLRHE